jgi:hypothetical protein
MTPHQYTQMYHMSHIRMDDSPPIHTDVPYYPYKSIDSETHTRAFPSSLLSFVSLGATPTTCVCYTEVILLLGHVIGEHHHGAGKGHLLIEKALSHLGKSGKGERREVWITRIDSRGRTKHGLDIAGRSVRFQRNRLLKEMDC